MARPRKRWSASESPESPIRTTVTESRLIVSSRKWSGTKVPWSMVGHGRRAPAEGMFGGAGARPRPRRREGRCGVVTRSSGCPKAAASQFPPGVSAMKNPSRYSRRVRRGDDDKVGVGGRPRVGRPRGRRRWCRRWPPPGRADGGHDERRMGNGVGSEQGHGITFLLEERVGSECRRGRGRGHSRGSSRDSGFAFMMTHRIRIPHRTAKASRDCIRRLPTNRQQSGARR